MLQADVATVLRDGRLGVVPAVELVPGDIVEMAGVVLGAACMRAPVAAGLTLTAPAETARGG